MDPAAAGFCAEFTEESWFSAAACPGPLEPAVKIPGTAEAMFTVAIKLVRPENTTTTGTAVPVASSGIWKLICPGETKNKGTGLPSTHTCVPNKVVGSGNVVALREIGRA